eukprot:GFUD01007599.1.p1 GENE.GFUD01007599.1~~GFUD01007599.1.p1  ORF type:complete len:360 (+),score=139.28 GFUD01007599.1:57-1136(+)
MVNETPVEAEKVTQEEKEVAVEEKNGNEVTENKPIEETKQADADHQAGKAKTVQELIDKVKNDAHLSNSSKMDTLAILVMRFVEENSELQNEAAMVNDQMKKHKEAKEAIKALNGFLKKQIDLVKQESLLRLQEEQSKREQSMGGYQNTMGELSVLLETHQEKNTSLKDQNVNMSDQMTLLVKETEKREGQIQQMQMEFQLQLKLLEHQVAKAQIEKAEVKADMTQDRLVIMKDLAAERDRNFKLDETVQLLKKQAEIYQKQMGELQRGAGDSTRSFEFFKTQIEKLTDQMVQLEKESAQWKEKSEMSSSQVAKMSLSTMDKEKEMILIKSKLESMIKLNKTLSTERAELLEKVKQGAD